MAKLGDVCTRGSSNLMKKEIEQMSGNYPIYGASGLIGSSDFYHQEKPYVAVVKDGAGVGRAMLLPAKSSVIGTLQYLIPNENILPDYLFYVVQYMHLEKYFTGATIPHIYFKDYKNESFHLDNLETQQKIVDALNKVSSLISLRNQQLEKLDELVKARFVEMFGDPVQFSSETKAIPMTEICEIIDGDRGKNYPKQEEFSENGYCLFLNAKNVTSTGFCFDNCMFITQEKDELLRKGKLIRGDVVLTTRGTIGNLAYYDDSVPFEHMRINSGMVILRMKKDVMLEKFFIEQFKFQLDSIKQKVASGSAQPQLPISTMNKIMMLVPDMGQQKQFEKVISEIEITQSTIQRSMDKLETLKNALMQQYFG